MNASTIPIQNLYYLLCYAWDHLAEGKLVDVASTPCADLAELLATTLEKGVRHVERRGLDQEYLGIIAEVPGIRGRVDLLTTTRRLLHLHGRSACTFDELSVNTLANQIIRATLKLLTEVESLDPGLKSRLLAQHRNLRGIEPICLGPPLFRRVQIHSNNRFYRFLLNVCELACQCWLPEEGKGRHRFRDFDREDRAMARVFERFLSNFAKRECKWWDVTREHVKWEASSASDPGLELLPRMETDITLRDEIHHVVVDAKYYSQTLNAYHGARKLKGGNLYQLLTYLQNGRNHVSRKLSGMLIYPDVGDSLDETYDIWGFPVRVATLNLAQEWRGIQRDLLGLFAAATQEKIAA